MPLLGGCRSNRDGLQGLVGEMQGCDLRMLSVAVGVRWVVLIVR
jgi:hypothetical protein